MITGYIKWVTCIATYGQGSKWDSMAYRHFFGCLKTILALLISEKSYWYALQAILWDLGNWSLMFASISGQNNASFRGWREGRHSNHTGTYFFPLRALHMDMLSLNVAGTTRVTSCRELQCHNGGKCITAGPRNVQCSCPRAYRGTLSTESNIVSVLSRLETRLWWLVVHRN